MSEQITRNAGRIAAGTTVSRILGYIRDMLVAHTFGAGLAADAFYAAYRIPNLLRRLLGEGSLSASFIPVLSNYLHTRSKEETQEFINALFTVLTIVLIILTVLGIVFAPQIVSLIAHGFTDTPEKLQLTVDLTRLMFPFLLFICLAAIAMGILNVMSSFMLPAVAPASLSVAEIGFILAIAPMLSPGNQIRGLAISVIAGGAGQLLVQLPRIYQLGWKLQWKLTFAHPGMQRVGKLMVPSMLGMSVDQINAFVVTMAASFLAQGSITALYYSNRIMQLPLAIFGLAVASVALPALSKCVAQCDTTTFKDTLNYSMRTVIFILVPSAVGLIVVGLPIIQVLFERGQFTHSASLLTYTALIFDSLGLPAFATVKILASGFYAYQETKTPVKIAVMSMLLNLVLIYLLMKPMGVGGLTLAAATASWFYAGALIIVLRNKVGPLGVRKILNTAFRTLIASGLMAAVAYAIAFKLLVNYPLPGMVTALAASVVVFFAASSLLKIEERKPLLRMLLRKPV
jgi:putative peptidoglycan lipid II flippase